MPKLNPNTGLRVRAHTILRERVLPFVAASVIAFGATAAGAQDAGTPGELSNRAEIADFLERAYDETPVAGGLTANGELFEVFVSSDGESWTMIVTAPDGESRVLAVGDAWMQLLEPRGERI